MTKQEKIKKILFFIEELDGRENTWLMANDILPGASEKEVDQIWEVINGTEDDMNKWDMINDLLDV